MAAPGSFAFYEAEGDTCAKNSLWDRANAAYESALELKPQHVGVLLARSRVNIHLGRPEVALQDADKVLALNAKDHRGLYAKAEALFAAGDFEYALMFYHRGNHIRPDTEFRLGIQKAEQAISDSVAQDQLDSGAAGGKLSETLRNTSMSASRRSTSVGAARGRGLNDTSVDNGPPASGLMASRSGAVTPAPAGLSSTGGGVGGGTGGGSAARGATAASAGQAGDAASATPGKSQQRKLLGEMYADRAFLEQLADDKSVGDLANSALKYLDTRTEFWRQQNPPRVTGDEQSGASRGATARTRSRMGGATSQASHASGTRGVAAAGGAGGAAQRGRSAVAASGASKGARSASGGPGSGAGAGDAKSSRQKYLEQTRYAIQTLENVNAAIDYGDPELGLKFAKGFLSRLATLEIPDKPRILGNLYSCMGITYMELGKLTLAAIHHRKDLDIAVKYNYKDAYLRSLGNLGQVYQRMGDYSQAIAMYEKKLMFGDESEAARLSESIGRCYIESGDVDNAVRFAERAIKAAQANSDAQQQMSAYLLHGQALSQGGSHTEAVTSFERALELARELNDVAAQANALTHLGQAYLQLNDVQKSIELQQQALELSAQLNAQQEQQQKQQQQQQQHNARMSAALAEAAASSEGV